MPESREAVTSQPIWTHDIEEAVISHRRYIAAGRAKVVATGRLDRGEGKGLEHDEFTRRIRELREAGIDV